LKKHVINIESASEGAIATSEINISKLAKALEIYSVEKLYSWEFTRDNETAKLLFTPDELKKLKEQGLFDVNIFLKEILKKKINGSIKKDQEYLNKVYRWIVREWGGIKAGDDENLYKLADEAIRQESLSFKRIASISKILSFYKPSKHIIYDARIIYSLNALMFLENASHIYFPIPNGRNSRMAAFDINVLIRIKNKPEIYKRKAVKNRNLISQADRALFIPKDQAYEQFRKTVISLHQKICSDQNQEEKKDKPYYTEMLLFAIADTHIYDRILNEVEITI
jgi:hypothetical protein